MQAVLNVFVIFTPINAVYQVHEGGHQNCNQLCQAAVLSPTCRDDETLCGYDSARVEKNK